MGYSGQATALRLSAPAATEEGSYERASGKQNHADCEHDKAARNPPSYSLRDAQLDHYGAPYGQQEETTSRSPCVRLCSILRWPSEFPARRFAAPARHSCCRQLPRDAP
jgi:hypothetical protein